MGNQSPLKRLIKWISQAIPSSKRHYSLQKKGLIITHKKESGEILSQVYDPKDHPSYQSAIQHMISGEDGGMWVVYAGEPHYTTYREVPGENGGEGRWSN